MLSAGMFSDLAARMAVRNRGLVSGSPPFFAAMLISLIRRVKILPRLASSAPFLCLIVAHFEWPDMEIPRYLNSKFRRNRPKRRSSDSLETDAGERKIITCALCQSVFSPAQSSAMLHRDNPAIDFGNLDNRHPSKARMRTTTFPVRAR